MDQLKDLEVFLHEKKEISSGLKVRFVNEPLEGTIVGFVHVKFNEFIPVDAYRINVGINLFLYADGRQNRVETIPISKLVKIAQEKIPLTNISYIEHLDSLNHKLMDDIFKYGRRSLASNTESLKRNFPERIVCADGTYYYMPVENDFILSSRDIIHSVSQNFFCVCSYINPIKGIINYTLKPLNELIPILQK